MKVYHWTETTVENAPDEWVPAEVALQLREVLDELVRELDRIEPDPIEHQWMSSPMRAKSLAALLDTKV